MRYYRDNSRSIGNTPLVQLRRVAGTQATVLDQGDGVLGQGLWPVWASGR